MASNPPGAATHPPPHGLIVLPRMLRRSLCLGALALGACGGGDLRKVRVPRAGVRLNYDLAPGAAYDGHLKVGTTRAIAGMREHLNQNVECDAKLLVLGRDGADGGIVVAARVRNVDLDWAVPIEAGLSRDDFQKLAGEQLRGFELRFLVSPRGKILTRPTPSDSLHEAMYELFSVLEAAVGTSFIELPARNLRPGDRWNDNAEARTIGAKFDGLFEAKEDKGQLARLELDLNIGRTVTTEAGERQAQTEGRSRSLFDTRGYFASVDVEAQDFDPRVGMGIRQIAAEWTQASEGREDATSIQEISDPCDADYVGELQCPDAAQ